MRYFVFVEFTEPSVRGFLQELREALLGEKKQTPVHVTVRGPYAHHPEAALIGRLEEELRGYGVVIGGAGTFATDEGYAVYLRAQSPVFQEIWWKRDFPQASFGINPHITLFETALSRHAKAVESFLRSERVEIFTFGLRLSVRDSQQSDLFSADTVPPPGILVTQLPGHRWRVKPGIIKRAEAFRGNLVRH